MKKPTQSLFALAITAALFVSSCGKKYDPGPNPSTVYDKSKLNELFKEFRSTPEVQCVTAGIQQTISFAKGTRLTFYPNSFKDASGAIITSGTVCLEVTEMYKPGDMIANRATTVTNDGKLLQSGGQVYIKATKDEQEVFANRYGIAYPQPAASSLNMSLFYGNTANTDSVITWVDGSQATVSGGTASGTSADTVLIRYQFDSVTNFSYINCDQFSSYSNITNVFIRVPDNSFNNGNSQIFLIFPSINSVTFLGEYSSDNNVFSLRQPYYKVPVGMKINIVVMNNKDGNYFYYEQTGITVTENMTLNTTPTKQSLEFIKAKLSAL